jgi:hypothetical protein
MCLTTHTTKMKTNEARMRGTGNHSMISVFCFEVVETHELDV